MHRLKIILFTVTNDLTYDQRMIRICSSLVKNDYHVMLIGRKLPDSLPLIKMPFLQKRLKCFFNKGFLFYAEYNFRLFFYLLFKKSDIICAVDLDTIIPCYLVSVLKNIRRVYDAHELFCEMKEIVSRPDVYGFWKRIERSMVPRYTSGYTVNEFIAAEFNIMYGVSYAVIRNMPILFPPDIPCKPEKYILYQGAVNEGRSFETLIPAMNSVPAKLVICGDGNFMMQAKKIVSDYRLEEKVIFTGKQTPEALRTYTINAYIGVTLFDDVGLSNYYSLANRFFDYMHAAIPQVCVDYPVYRAINDQFDIAILTSDLSSDNIARQLNFLLNDSSRYRHLQMNCLHARKTLNWNEEEKQLLSFYQKILNTVD
jgi:glycosyltransferase involved in cell wall biosynthesis